MRKIERNFSLIRRYLAIYLRYLASMCRHKCVWFVPAVQIILKGGGGGLYSRGP